MEFLSSAGKALILGSAGVVIIDEKELREALERAAKLEAEAQAKAAAANQNPKTT